MNALHECDAFCRTKLDNSGHEQGAPFAGNLDIQGWRCESNPDATPEGHWVGMVFRNAYGTHMLELNGRKPLPDHDPQLRSDLEYLLWHYGLLSQQDTETDEERVGVAQELWLSDRNHVLAKCYMVNLCAHLSDTI